MRTIEQAAQNLEASIPQIQVRYQQGVQTADWATPAGSDAAESLWAQNVATAAQQKRRQKGIQAVGNAAWQQAAMNKGAAAIGAGVRAGMAKYRSKFGPVLQAMQGAAASLPPRTADPYQNIVNRVTPIVKAARNAVGKN